MVMLETALEAALEFVTQSFQLDMGGWVTLIAFAVIGYTLIALMLDDHLSALLGSPLLVAGTALGNRALSELGVQLASDKVINMVIGMASCMLASGVLFVLILWVWSTSMAR